MSNQQKNERKTTKNYLCLRIEIFLFYVIKKENDNHEKFTKGTQYIYKIL